MKQSTLAATVLKRIGAKESEIKTLLRKRKRTIRDDRNLSDAYRSVLRIFQDAEWCGLDRTAAVRMAFRNLVPKGMMHLGGQDSIRSFSLKDYDHRRFGPYLGVSDEGSAAGAICRAVSASPKAAVFGSRDPMITGAAVDAERLMGVGETAVGPEEYARVRTACGERMMTSSNVGTRVNLRFYRRHPLVTVFGGPAEKALQNAKQALLREIDPFLKAPGGRPRPVTVFVKFWDNDKWSGPRRIALLKSLVRAAREAGGESAVSPRIGYQIWIPSGKKGRDAAIAGIDIARKTGIREVAVEGRVRTKAQEQLSLPGLLNYLAPRILGPVLAHADSRKVYIRPVNTVDPGTVARHIWSGLLASRRMGCHLGKYGLFPLTLEESGAVICDIQSWFKDWSAAPVFFVDQGLVSRNRVDTRRDMVRGLKTWLEMVARRKVRVVLIDTIDKTQKKPLLDLPGEKRGFMSLGQLMEVDKMARNLGIKVLWAGGITLPQVFELGRAGVFGIYVTSAASAQIPVTPEYEPDPSLPAVKEPTFEGVFRTKLLLEAGFVGGLPSKASGTNPIEKAAKRLLDQIRTGDKAVRRTEKELADLTEDAWRGIRAKMKKQ